MYGSNSAGFSFKKRYERVDWRKIAAVDVERVARELDFTTLQDNIANITFCTIENEVGLVDPNFLKLFKIAQLTMEYLLHSQDYLSSVITGLEEKLASSSADYESSKRELQSCREELKKVKAESHKRKKLLIAQQVMMDRGPDSFHACPYCTKGFINQSFLTNHVQKRHKPKLSEYLLAQRSSVVPAGLQQTAQVQQAQPQGTEQPVAQIESAQRQELENLQRQLRETEQALSRERKAAAEKHKEGQKASQRQQENSVEDNTQLEQRYKEELQKMHDVYMKDLREMEEKHSAVQQALQRAAKARNQGAELRDADESTELSQLREKTERLRQELHEQKQSAETALQFRQKKVEKKWEKKLDDVVQHYESRMTALEEAVRTTAKNGSLKTINQEVEELKQDLQEQRIHAQHGKETRSAQRKEDISSAAEEIGMPPIPAIRSNSSLGTEQRTANDDSDAGDQELGRSLGSTRSMRLVEKLRHNPNVLTSFRAETNTKLQEKLERYGVDPNARGLSASQLERYMNNICMERKSKFKKYDNSVHLRSQYGSYAEMQRAILEQIDGQARRKLGVSRIPKNYRDYNSTGETTMGSNMGTVIRGKQAPPRPEPRSSRREPNGTLSSLATTNQGTMKSVESEYSETEYSEESEATSSEEETETATTPQMAGRARSSVGPRSSETLRAEAERAKRGLQPTRRDPPPPASGTHRTERPNPAVRVPQAPAVEESDDGWDTDELSDMDGVKPQASSTPQQNKVESVVSQTAKSIELQLMGRNVKKPAGAVDIVKTSQRQVVSQSVQSSVTNEEDDLCSVSEISDVDPPPSQHMGIKRGNAGLAHAGNTRSSLQSGTGVQNLASWDDDSDLEI